MVSLSFCGAAWLSEWPLAVHVQRRAAHTEDSSKRRRAAIAVRDHVNAFQKWGTQLFVQPTLAQGYHKVHYFTQFSKDDIKPDFLAALRASLQTYDAVDIFLYIHNNWRYVWWILRGIKPKLRKKLRLVYNTGCHNLSQGSAWLRLGADVYVGHPGRLSISPIFAVYFARRWIVGVPVKEAVAQANAATKPRLLLASALSFGYLNGPRLWRGTKASLVGAGDAVIGSYTPTHAHTIHSHATKRPTP